MSNLTKRAVDAAKPSAKDYFLWCGSTPGFGVRVYPSGKKIFVAQVRVGRRLRRVKIGTFGPYTVEQARTRAEAIIRVASDGRDPQLEKTENKTAISVAELCESYMEAARKGLVTTRFRQPKRSTTVAIDEGRVSRHIVPLVGTITARDLKSSDVQRMADLIGQGRTAGTFKGKTRGKAVVRGGTGTAARVVELLGGIYSWAEKRGLVAGPNPVRRIDKVRGQPRLRSLSEGELRRLGRTLAKSEAEAPMAVAAMRIIALTGLRQDEACSLRWSEIDEVNQCLRLETTKTGRSVRPVGRAVLEMIESIPVQSREWLFPNRDNSGRAELKKTIAGIFDAAGLKDVRSHDLRRTFASIAADEGYSDATIAALLGHAQRSVTARHYIRRPDEALIAAAERVSSRIGQLLAGIEATVVRLPVKAQRSA